MNKTRSALNRKADSSTAADGRRSQLIFTLRPADRHFGSKSMLVCQTCVKFGESLVTP